MDLNKITCALSPCAEAVAIVDKTAAWFIFGTGLSSRLASDIDIAIVYEDLRVPDFVRSYTRIKPPPFPLHLTFVDVKEEMELKFLNLVAARPLF